jgi:hypothetical protein
MFFLRRQTSFYGLEALPCFLELFSGQYAALFFEAVKNVDHVSDSRQIHDAIPSSLILIAQLKTPVPIEGSGR